MQYLPDDTIVALATPQGVGAIGVIRLSGKTAIRICNGVFTGKNLNNQDSHTIHFGTISNNKILIDEVVASIFKEPNSYTKENVVEVSCHGSPYILQQVLELFIEKGARLAQPGEFTLRAFLNGRFDLSQAEAVADLIASNSASSHNVALKQMRGGFSNKIKELRYQLVHFASMIELELDFAEEDVAFANLEELRKLINQIQTLIGQLVQSFKLGNVIKNGVTTVIAGRPNAGKSTLLNALLQEDRAIVSEIAGTTRDTIEEVININGITFRLVDTAGLRDAGDKIEQLGVQKTMEKIGQSALLVYLFDVNEISSNELEADLAKIKNDKVPLLVVGNKIDLVTDKSNFGERDIIYISSKDESNIEALKQQLVSAVLKGKTELDMSIVTNIRHVEALQKANEALDDVMQGLDIKASGELLALDIRQALHALGEITGEVTTDDLLGNIFSKFCIGK